MKKLISLVAACVGASVLAIAGGGIASAEPTNDQANAACQQKNVGVVSIVDPRFDPTVHGYHVGCKANGNSYDVVVDDNGAVLSGPTFEPPLRPGMCDMADPCGPGHR